MERLRIETPAFAFEDFEAYHMNEAVQDFVVEKFIEAFYYDEPLNQLELNYFNIPIQQLRDFRKSIIKRGIEQGTSFVFVNKKTRDFAGYV